MNVFIHPSVVAVSSPSGVPYERCPQSCSHPPSQPWRIATGPHPTRGTDVRRSQPIPAPEPAAGPSPPDLSAAWFSLDAFGPSAGAVGGSPAPAAMDYRAVAVSQAVPGQFDDAECSDG